MSDVTRVHEILGTERALIGRIRVPDGSEAAYLIGYAEALDYALDLIAHRTDAVSDDELRAHLRGEQIASSILSVNGSTPYRYVRGPDCPDCGSQATTLYPMGEDAWTLYCDDCKREEPCSMKSFQQ